MVMVGLLRLFVAVVLLITLSFLIAVLVVIGNMPDLPKSQIKELCLPFHETKDALSCEADRLQLYTLHTIESSYNNIKQKYYDEDKTVGKDLIGLKQFIKNYNSDMRPSVRMVGDYSSPNKTGLTVLVPVRSWVGRKHIAQSGGFRRFGVEIRNGRIIVPISGIYEVYSYLQFREPCQNGKPESESKESVKHSIFKYDVTTGKDTELMHDVQPHKMSQNVYTSIYDSYLVSLFDLRSGDELSVKVNEIDLLEVPEFNFFGAQFIEDIKI